MDPTPAPGRKVVPDYENPVDDALLRVVDLVCPVFRSLGATPNMLTAVSGVLGLAAVWAVQHGNLPAFAGLWMLSYFFDCVDGHYARRYDMVTEAGDWFDHVKDQAVAVLLVVVVHARYAVPWWAGGVLALAVLAAFSHFGCQQRVYDPQDRGAETLDVLQRLCPSPDGRSVIPYTRFFGAGTLQVVIIAVVWWTVRHAG